MNRVAIPLVGALAILCAPPAHASSLWGAIAYFSDSRHGRFTDYGTKTQLIMDIQNSWSGAGYVPFPSGKCGAVASYPFLGETKFSTGTGTSLDAATNQAINGTVGDNYTLLDAFCQR